MELVNIAIIVYLAGISITSLIWLQMLMNSRTEETSITKTINLSIFIGFGWLITLPITLIALYQEREMVSKLRRKNSKDCDKE